jgi:orotidine-5'-phosphate decarboxylase
MVSEKLIVALDFPNIDEAKNLVNELGDEVVFYKIGLELMMSGHYFEMIKWLKSKDKKVFADLKLYDIAETVGRAVKNLANYDIDLLTIHASSKGIMQRAAENKGNMKIIGVTVLTNLDENDLFEMGFDRNVSLQDLVIKKTDLALNSGLDGVVASALETKLLRRNFGNDFDIITPGIRLERIANDDQKRVASVEEALNYGANYLVVGRPITRSENPKEAANKFNNLLL